MAAENLGMAAAQRPEADNPPPALLPSPYDPNLDSTVRQLLDQQAEIKAKLAALLPQRYGPDIKSELDMLRHKLQVLEAYANDNRKLPSLLRCLSSLFCAGFPKAAATIAVAAACRPIYFISLPRCQLCHFFSSYLLPLIFFSWVVFCEGSLCLIYCVVARLHRQDPALVGD